MADLVLNALRRNREIAVKAGLDGWVERIDARLAAREKPKRSAKKKKEIAEEVPPPEEPAVPEPEPWAEDGDYTPAA